MGLSDELGVEDSAVDQSGLRVEEDKVGQGEASAAEGSPFDLLPVELLRKILFFAIEPREMSDVGVLLVNKTCYDVGRSDWRQEEHAFMLNLELDAIGADDEVLQLECRSIGAFTHLRSLRLSGLFLEDVSLPYELSDALRQLEHLRSLTLSINRAWDMEDTSFCVANDLPQLRHLVLNRHCSCAKRFLTPPPTALETFETTIGEHSPDLNSTIPWLSIPCVKLRPIHDPRVDLKELIAEVDTQQPTPTTCAVPHFSFLSKSSNHLKFDLATDLKFLHRVVLATGIESLELDCIVPLRPSPVLPPLPSVRSLILRAVIWNTPGRPEPPMIARDLLELHKILSSFPSLHSLVLYDFLFDAPSALSSPPPPPAAPPPLTGPDSLEFQLRLPLLTTFLCAVRKTKVVRFAWRIKEGVGYEWVRRDEGEEFQVERYRAF
ncbi:hypothetical protein JCM8547_002941 [Rhodosporidiobolus lusitaniae]